MQIHHLDLIADQLVFVNLDITCWSGKKVLTPEDLGLQADQLPPDTLVSLGDKQLIDPKALRDFTTLRSAARRACATVGTRFMGGYVVPARKAQRLLSKLSQFEQQFNAKRQVFLARFDTLIQAWTLRQKPEWQRLIEEALVPAAYVGERLSFAAQAVRLGTPEPEVVAHHGLEAAVGGLSSQLFYEISMMAKETYEKSFKDKIRVSHRALSPIKAIRDKLDGLAFINSGIRPVVDEIDTLLAAVPHKMPITGSALKGLQDFLRRALLCNLQPDDETADDIDGDLPFVRSAAERPDRPTLAASGSATDANAVAVAGLMDETVFVLDTASIPAETVMAINGTDVIGPLEDSDDDEETVEAFIADTESVTPESGWFF